MTPILWRRVKDVYFAAAELAPGEREPFLNRECAGDNALRHEVERLLNADSALGVLDSPVAPARSEGLKTGDLLGHFRIESPIGKGGGGLVYKATDTQLNRTVAIKVIRDDSGDPNKRRRFAREAEAASALNHPGIITVYQTGTEADRDYIAMEFVDGQTLHAAIGHRALALEKTLRYAIEIADAVHAAHEAGIVHRDLKPGNVMITDRGRVKVLDFGLAKATPAAKASADTATMTLTASGTLVGTFAYMSPEQAEGKAVDTRSDIFSFGCILYEMMAGRRAFQADSEVGALAAVLKSDPRPIRELSPHTPRDLERVIAGCLRKLARDRWQNLGDVKAMLEQTLKDLESGVLAADPASPAAPPRGRWLLPAVAALCGAAVAALGVWKWSASANRPRPEPRVTMLTADAGLSAYPALSKDGSILAYASDRAGSGDLDIWVQQIGGRDPIRLTKWESDETDPDISPDGTHVAFRSEKDGGGIYVVATFGGEPILVAPGGKNPHFSPDGKLIAYWAGREGPGYVPESAHAYAAPWGGGQAERLDNGFAAGLYPIWSPKGDAVIVLGRKDASTPMAESTDWWVVARNGSPARKTGAIAALRSQRLGISSGQTYFTPLAWLGAPDRILVAANFGDVTNIWEMGIADSGKPTSIPRPLTRGTAFEAQSAWAALPAGGSRFAYASLSLNVDVWSLPLDANQGKTTGELTRITEETSVEMSPSLSWDGGVIAFLSRRAGTWSLRTRTLASGADRTLLMSGAQLFTPKITGDGRNVVYKDDARAMLSVGSQGGAPRTICARCGTPSDSGRDGSQILAERLEGPSDLIFVDGSTGSTVSAVKELKGVGALSKANQSHDGKWIAFQVALPGSTNVQIFATKTASAAKRKEWSAVTDGKSMDRGPVWAPADGLIYFLSERDGSACIWARKLDHLTKAPSGDPFPVRHFHGSRRSFRWLNGSINSIGLSVGGNVAVFTLGELSGNIWLREEQP